jgi:hypothetical protein
MGKQMKVGDKVTAYSWGRYFSGNKMLLTIVHITQHGTIITKNKNGKEFRFKSNTGQQVNSWCQNKGWKIFV